MQTARPLTVRWVQLLVANSREANIFRTVDMVLGGRTSNALRLIKQMQESGADAGYIIAMLARQLRLMLLAKDLVVQVYRVRRWRGVWD